MEAAVVSTSPSAEFIDTTITLPDFPSMKSDRYPDLNSENDFSKTYHSHNKRILETVTLTLTLNPNPKDFRKTYHSQNKRILETVQRISH